MGLLGAQLGGRAVLTLSLYKSQLTPQPRGSKANCAWARSEASVDLLTTGPLSPGHTAACSPWHQRVESTSLYTVDFLLALSVHLAGNFAQC